MNSSIKIKKGQIEDFISDSTQQELDDKVNTIDLAPYGFLDVQNKLKQLQYYYGTLDFVDTVLDDYSNIDTILGNGGHNHIIKLDDGSFRYVTQVWNIEDWNGLWVENAVGAHFWGWRNNGSLTHGISAPLGNLEFRVSSLETTVTPSGKNYTYHIYEVNPLPAIEDDFPSYWVFNFLRPRLNVGTVNYEDLENLPDLSKFVKTDVAQTFTDAEKTQGRSNIGAEKRSAVRVVAADPSSQNFVDWESDILLVKTARTFTLPAAGTLPNGSRYMVKTTANGTIQFALADGSVSIEYNDVNATGYMSQRSEAWVLFQDNVYYISGEVS